MGGSFARFQVQRYYTWDMKKQDVVPIEKTIVEICLASIQIYAIYLFGSFGTHMNEKIAILTLLYSFPPFLQS